MSEKKRKITVQEIVIIIILLLVAAGFIIYSAVTSSSDDDDSSASDIEKAFEGSSSFKEAVSALGSENLLPDDDGYYYVWFESDGEVEEVAYDDMTFVSGYVYGENSCCITVYSDEKYGKIVGYSKTLGYDILKINVAYSTGAFSTSCENIEADFAKYYLREKYPDCAFISDGKLKCVEAGEIAESDSALTKTKLYVTDTLTSSVISVIATCTSIEEAVIYDCGTYIFENGCIFSAKYAYLEYVFPYVEEATCPEATFGISATALTNAKNLTSLTIPCCGYSLNTLMGAYAANLKSVTFTSCVLEAEELFYGCSSLEDITFLSGFTDFEDGYFSGAAPLYITFEADTEYVYLDIYSMGCKEVKLPSSCKVEGEISRAEYTLTDVAGVQYKVYRGN